MPMNLSRDGKWVVATVIFATDRSPISQTAGMFATTLARYFRSELVIAHAFIPSQTAKEVELLRQLPSEDRSERLRSLEATAVSLRSRGLNVKAKLLEGDPSEELPAIADAQKDSVLVLGTHGGSSLGRRLIGSTAEECLRRVACPAITVGPHVSPPLSTNPFRTILYATDCSTAASQAAPLACAIAASFEAELKVITIVDDKDERVPDLIADLDFRTQHEIDHELKGQCVHFKEVRAIAKASNARDEILRYAAACRADLILLGIHRRRSIELFSRNSVTIQLISSANCPVLTITAEDLDGGTGG
jgi:nucleotide-binding universal stress UspA family protein